MMWNRRWAFAKKIAAITLAVSMTAAGVKGSAFYSYATSANTTQSTEATTQATTQTDTGSSGGGTTDGSLAKARQDATDAENRKKTAQEILDNLKSAKSNIENYIIELDKSLNELQIEITHLKENQQQLEESIAETQKQLDIATAAQEQQYEEMKQRIQMVYESGNKQYLDVLLTAGSMSDMLNKMEYVSQVSYYDYNMLNQLKTAKQQVANLKMKLDKDLSDNEKLQQEVNDQQKQMELLVQEKSAQVKQYDESIAGQQEEVNKYAQAQAEAEAIIAQAEQNAGITSAGSGGTYTGGVFTWPVPSSHNITSYFGNRTSPTAGASTYHRGIDIACSTGDSIVAASSGTVIVATYNAAEGNYICIDHGGGVVTVYMHNSSLLVSVGETVTAGQTIALAGSTGYSTGPHCHFGVRVNGTYVDPLGYLQ